MNQLEGILLTKTPFKDKNIIGHVLLRSGFKVSVMFYGGQGGGKKHKGSILQLGYLLSFNISGQRSESFDILSSNQYQEKWYHNDITNQAKAFYLLCFFNEFLDKFSPTAHSKHDLEVPGDSHVGLFRLLSNAIFRLQSECLEKSYNHYNELGIFLVKSLVELGIFPDTSYCVVSGHRIGESDSIILSADNGGFSFEELSSTRKSQIHASEPMNLAYKMKLISESKYLDIKGVSFTQIECSELFNFVCYQQHVRQNEFKTFSMIL